MQNLHKELHPVELLLLAGMALLWALATAARLVLVPALALLLTLAGWRPAAPAAAAVTAGTERAPTPAPAPVTAASPVPPLMTLADLAQEAAASLEPLTVAQLRQRARAAGLPRSLTRNGRRAALLSLLAGLEVAMA